MLLMDEPFGALDHQTRELMQELLLGIWEEQRKTVLFVTHDIDEAVFMGNRVIVMSARPGRIKLDRPVPIAYPRNYTLKTTPAFAELKAELTEQACRMGDDPKTSVLNPYCQSWDVKNLFVTDGAPFVSNADKNPTLSILALAWRTTDDLLDQLAKREI